MASRTVTGILAQSGDSIRSVRVVDRKLKTVNSHIVYRAGHNRDNFFFFTEVSITHKWTKI